MLVVGANGEDEVVDGTVVVAHLFAHGCAAHIYFGVVGIEIHGLCEVVVGHSEIVLLYGYACQTYA